LGLADGGDRQLTRTRERLSELIDYARERAELENRDYALACAPEGCRFLAWEARDRQWAFARDDLLSKWVRLDDDWRFTAIAEGRPVLLGPLDGPKAPDPPRPVAIFYAGGELSEFELRIGDASTPARFALRANNAPEDSVRRTAAAVPQPRVELLLDGRLQD
jgi:hypothetical protein